jgi:hypothetical protein
MTLCLKTYVLGNHWERKSEFQQLYVLDWHVLRTVAGDDSYWKLYCTRSGYK